ncbi:MAG: hypothetical protein ACK4F8_08190 [Aquabacterium sp.]
MLHSGRFVGCVRAPLHEQEGVLVRVGDTKVHVSPRGGPDAIERVRVLEHGLAHDSRQLQHVFVLCLGDQSAFVFKQGIDHGGGIARQLGHFAQRDLARAAFLDQLAHDLDDGFATVLGFALLANVLGAQRHGVCPLRAFEGQGLSG